MRLLSLILRALPVTAILLGVPVVAIWMILPQQMATGLSNESLQRWIWALIGTQLGCVLILQVCVGVICALCVI